MRCETAKPNLILPQRAITFVQRFGSALQLNVHFHVLVLDGAFDDDGVDVLQRSRVRARCGSSPGSRSPMA